MGPTPFRSSFQCSAQVQNLLIFSIQTKPETRPADPDGSNANFGALRRPWLASCHDIASSSASTRWAARKNDSADARISSLF